MMTRLSTLTTCIAKPPTRTLAGNNTWRLSHHGLAVVALLMISPWSSQGISFLDPRDVRNTAINITRTGVLDQIASCIDPQSNATTSCTNANANSSIETLYYCHIANFLAFSLLLPSGRIPFRNTAPPMTAAVLLALDMLNTGDGSVIQELEGLNHHCPIRFTAEFLDTSLSQSATVQQTNQLLNRQTEHDQVEVCAFIGAARSAVSIPMAILTGLANRVQLSYVSTSTVLDDTQQFPLFGRLVPSDEGVALPYLQFLRARGVRHLGVVHWNDDYGNAYARAMLKTASTYFPEMTILSVDIPRLGSPAEYQEAVLALKESQFRWFFGVFGGDSDYVNLMEQAAMAGIAGTGRHVWIFSDSLGTSVIPSLEVERNSPLARVSQGVGMVWAQGGRPGMTVFDKFYAKWRAMVENPENLALVAAQQPLYADEPEYTGHDIDESMFDEDTSRPASVVFDEIILLGLSACRTLAMGQEVDGKAMFETLLQISFQGATGNVTVDPKTGTRLPATAFFRMDNFVQEPINETHVTFGMRLSEAFIDGQWVEEEPFVFNDGTTTTPSDLPAVEINYNHIHTGIRAAGLTMATVVLGLSVALAGWTIYNRKRHVIRASQPIFLTILCTGTFVMGSTIIPLSIDDARTSPEGCSTACMSVPWLFCSGWALVFAAIFAKIWRINRLFNNPSIKRVKVTAMDVMYPLIGLMILNFIVLTSWNIVSPLVWERQVSSVDVFGRTVESRGYCTSEHFLPFAIILVVMDLGALVVASYQSYLARDIATEFAESEYIGRAIACMLLVCFVGIPTMIMVSDSNANARFFVLTCIIFVVCASVLLFIFVPKIMSSKKNLKSSIRRSVSQRSQQINVKSSATDNDNNISRILWAGGSESLEVADADAEGIRIMNRPEQLRMVSFENGKLKAEKEELKARNNELEKQISELRALVPGHEAATASISFAEGD
ncbi:acid type B receptor subunit 2 [Seminavis robusta]|uniref:Acid type B receptor subunit 2 n=1 Tax=Seminavis robusta TaxID=568900 RepID=A0A9N8H5C6_9STRA|nr:acid type B receptor subunit 2 [Seminavis robusta]|eukprot:Sro21_g014650.1 acid type B receptor subunit 2 (949) ;mRNA; f:68460-71306